MFQLSRFDCEAPDLSNNLPLSRFHNYSPNIKNFYHKIFFSCQTAESDEKTSLQSCSPFTHVFLLDAQSRFGTNVITLSQGRLATPFLELKLSVELCSKFACRLFQCSKKLLQWITSCIPIILSISSAFSLHHKSASNFDSQSRNLSRCSFTTCTIKNTSLCFFFSNQFIRLSIAHFIVIVLEKAKFSSRTPSF